MCGAQMNVRDALNSAIDEEMSADSKVFVIGEEVRSLPELSAFGWKLKHLQC
jgi:pyruvate/2-oxoglutarate/acetoin dehydrogenase E1 component